MNGHDVRLESWKERRRGMRFRGVCSCGADSGPQPSAGVIHGWAQTHVDRFPELTSRLTFLSARALGYHQAELPRTAAIALGQASAVFHELQRQVGSEPREHEEMALAVFEYAQAYVKEGPEAARSVAGSHREPIASAILHGGTDLDG